MRASRQPGTARRASSASLIAGASDRAGGSRSFRVACRSAASDRALRHPSTGNSAAGENAPPRARNTAGVDTATPGLSSTRPAPGNAGAGVSTSPIPDIIAARPSRHTGTSAPSPRAIAPSAAASRSVPQKRCSSRNAAAASADPPPIPEATGKFFSRTSLPAARRPDCSASARAARSTRLSASAVQSRGEWSSHLQRQILGRRYTQPIAHLGEDHKAVQQVVAVIAPPDDVQMKVDLSRRELESDATTAPKEPGLRSADDRPRTAGVELGLQLQRIVRGRDSASAPGATGTAPRFCGQRRNRRRRGAR